MLGFDALGALALGDGEASFAFASIVATVESRNLDLRLLCHLEPYDLDATSTTNLYFSTHGFLTKPFETPANTYYKERMGPQFGWKRSLFSQGKVSGRSIPAFADIVLNNNDGNLDGFNDLAWGGRRARVYAGSGGFLLAEYVLIFDGTVQSITFGDTEVTVHLRDLQYTLDIELQTRVFAGSGGIEGGPDVINKRKPIGFGPCLNVSPVYLGADTGFHKFAIGDGRAIVGVLRVRDRGVEIDYTSSSTPLAGQWTFDPATAVVTLAVFDGPVTVDVIGRRYLSITSATSWTVATGSQAFLISATAGFVVGQTVRVARTSALGSVWGDGAITAVSADLSITVNVTSISDAAGPFTDWTIAPWGTVAGIVEAIATDLGIASFADALFTALDTAQPATAFKWIPEGGNGLQLLDELVNGAGCFYGFDPASREFEVGRVSTPASPVATYTDREILQDSFHRVETEEPNWQAVYRYGKNHTPMQGADLAGIVTDDDRAFLTAEWRWETAEDTGVQTAYPLSLPLEIDGVFYNQTDAAAEASRLLALFGVRSDYYNFDTKVQPLLRDVNDVVTLKRDVSARFGLTAGADGTILDIDVDLSKMQTTLGVRV